MLTYAAPLFCQAAVKSAFIRGSVIRYVHIPASAVDTTLLEDATRRGKKSRRVGLINVCAMCSPVRAPFFAEAVAGKR
jgi:hypothetical protein